MEGIFKPTGISTQVTYSPQNEQEAWIAIMHACNAVDGDVADEELEELTQTLVNKALFEGHDILAYSKAAFLAQAQLGSKHLIDNSVDKVSPGNKATLFALTVQLVMADCVVTDKEEELITYLYSALDLDTNLAERIIEVILILNKGNVCLSA